MSWHAIKINQILIFSKMQKSIETEAVFIKTNEQWMKTLIFFKMQSLLKK